MDSEILSGQPPDTLGLSDLRGLVEATRLDNQPARLFRAIDLLTARVIGHRLFTIMRFDADRFEVERLYTNMPQVYPVGGRKKKAETRWGDETLRSMKVFRATNPDQIRQHFDDYETLAGLGMGSILNIPIAYDGKCVGTMNMTHQAGWYVEKHEQIGVLIGGFLVTPLVQSVAQR